MIHPLARAAPLESTPSGRTYVGMLKAAREVGCQIELHYLYLATPEQAIARVHQRVATGGHDVPEPDIRRRFERSRANLMHNYLPPRLIGESGTAVRCQ